MVQRIRNFDEEKRPPIIALDGPSALGLYRDRDDMSQQQESVSSSNDSDEFWADCRHLSDEDIAAELLADANVYEHAIQADWTPWGEENQRDDAPDKSPLPRLERTRRCDLSRCSSRSAELKRVPLAALGVQPPVEGAPLYLLVSGSTTRRAVRNVRERTCSVALPSDCFKLLGSQVLVPTPEFCFLLLSKHVSLAILIQLGMEMCGHYRMVGAMSSTLTQSKRTAYNCDALTTPERIISFLDSMQGFPGINQARRAAQYLVADSASPMETILYMLLCLPNALGGYGLPTPALNAKRPVNQNAQSFTLSHTLIPDLYWKQARLDVEYDSEEFHASKDALDKGSRRTLALRAMHVDVFSMTSDMVHDEAAFHTFARLLARRLHKRIRKPTALTQERRAALRATLISQSSKGKISSKCHISKSTDWIGNDADQTAKRG